MPSNDEADVWELIRDARRAIAVSRQHLAYLAIVREQTKTAVEETRRLIEADHVEPPKLSK